MEVSYVEGVANHNGPESCVVVGNDGREALTGGGAGQVLSREIYEYPGCRRCRDKRKATSAPSPSQDGAEPRAVGKTLCMHSSTPCGNREIPRLARNGCLVRTGNSEEVTR